MEVGKQILHLLIFLKNKIVISSGNSELFVYNIIAYNSIASTKLFRMPVLVEGNMIAGLKCSCFHHSSITHFQSLTFHGLWERTSNIHNDLIDCSSVQTSELGACIG